MEDRELREGMELDNEPIAKILQGLKRVEAPGDFDFKVKARIASGAPRRPSGVPLWAKAAAPVGLLVAIAGYLGFTSLQPPNATDVTVASSQPQQKAEPPAAAVVAAPPAVTAQPITPPAVSHTDTATVATVKKPVLKTRPSGGTTDSAARIPKEIVLSDVPVADALLRSGIGAKYDGTGMKVESTNGAASRSGVKAGDVIESINGKAVDAGTTIKGKLAGKTISVRRDGKTIDILIKN